MKVLTVLGTRPEIIRLSRITARLDERLDHVLVHTGQNTDPSLNDVFFEDLDLRRPDHDLGIDSSSVGRSYGEVLIRIEPILEVERPDAVVILGDTNSSIAAVMARRMGIAVFHLEAGNRSFDREVPEETNRRVVDHVSDVNLVYTEHARRNLLAEGLHPTRVFLIGSPMREVIDHYRPKIDGSSVLVEEGLETGEYFVASIHREENVDRPDRLASLVEGLERVGTGAGLPVVMSAHPRTRRRLADTGLPGPDRTVRLHEPFCFSDYLQLQRNARCVISDSGTISEESAMLGFPAVTPRRAIERPEALDAGTIVLSGREPERMIEAVDAATAAGPPTRIPAEYEVTDTSTRVLRLLVGLETGRHLDDPTGPAGPS